MTFITRISFLNVCSNVFEIKIQSFSYYYSNGKMINQRVICQELSLVVFISQKNVKSTQFTLFDVSMMQFDLIFI